MSHKSDKVNDYIQICRQRKSPTKLLVFAFSSNRTPNRSLCAKLNEPIYFVSSFRHTYTHTPVYIDDISTFKQIYNNKKKHEKIKL